MVTLSSTLYLIRRAYLIAITDRRRTKGEKSNRTMCEINILYLQSLEDLIVLTCAWVTSCPGSESVELRNSLRGSASCRPRCVRSRMRSSGDDRGAGYRTAELRTLNSKP